MIPISIVITTKNHLDIVNLTLDMLKEVTDDIVIVNNGHEGLNWVINHARSCHLHQTRWDGYGANKNKGITLAKYDWILSLDADEIPDQQLIDSLSGIDFDDATKIYDIKFRSYFGDTEVKYGKWGRDHHIRLFNRNHAQWSDSPVHESLIFDDKVIRERLAGAIQHYSVVSLEHFNHKSELYAGLSANYYHKMGKRTTLTKLYLSPLFNFLKYYLLFLGFLDGKIGLEIALGTLKYTRLKYTRLREMQYSAQAQHIPVTQLSMR